MMTETRLAEEMQEAFLRMPWALEDDILEVDSALALTPRRQHNETLLHATANRDGHGPHYVEVEAFALADLSVEPLEAKAIFLLFEEDVATSCRIVPIKTGIPSELDEGDRPDDDVTSFIPELRNNLGEAIPYMSGPDQCSRVPYYKIVLAEFLDNFRRPMKHVNPYVNDKYKRYLHQLAQVEEPYPENAYSETRHGIGDVLRDCWDAVLYYGFFTAMMDPRRKMSGEHYIIVAASRQETLRTSDVERRLSFFSLNPVAGQLSDHKFVRIRLRTIMAKDR